MPLPVIYLDECVPHRIIVQLEQRGVSIRTTLNQGMANASVSDTTQIRYATARSWLILSTNEKDFVREHKLFQARGEEHHGVVASPQTGSSRRQDLRCAMLLDWIAVEHPDTRNLLFRWTDLQQLNSGYVLPSYTDEERAVALGRQA